MAPVDFVGFCCSILLAACATSPPPPLSETPAEAPKLTQHNRAKALPRRDPPALLAEYPCDPQPSAPPPTPPSKRPSRKGEQGKEQTPRPEAENNGEVASRP